MSDETKDLDKNLIKGHEYDGIQELDNPLPGWWLMTFYATIVFSAIYYYYYEFGSGPSSSKELAESLNSIKQAQVQMAEQAPSPEDVDYAALMVDDEAMQRAKKSYATVGCGACHGMSGEGVIGPNLTDNYWIYDGGNEATMAIKIAEGILDKGMPPHKDRLKPQEISELVAYIKTLAGTEPANAKAPQGDLVE